MPTATKRVAKKAAPVAPESEVSAIVASGIQVIPLGRLRRAPENVRHTNKDVDVESLADDIAAHGLLQNLIGYAGDTSIDKAAVYIVGGGRRLQALQLLRERGAIDDAFAVPVLLRPAAEAIELSLSENLAKRDMNPADEFLAFEALMKRGTVSPADLARQFGFSERYVKQRLRLAALAPEILDALRASEMTVAAAMAYGRAADQDVQRAVFKAQAKRSYDRHSPERIKYDIANQSKTTDWPLYRYVGADAYEREGGGYEDAGLFDDDSGTARKLTSAFTVIHQAHQHIDFQMIMRQRQMAEELDLHPDAVTGFVKVKDLCWGPYSFAYHGLDKQAPDGYAWVGNDYNADRVERMLKTIRNNRILCQLPVGVDETGALIRIPKGFFVPKDQAHAVDPPVQSPGHAMPTAEERAANERAALVRRIAGYLAARKVREDKVDGRHFWQSSRPWLNRSEDIPGVGPCYPVALHVFVTEAEIDAQLDAAAEALAKEEALAAARKEMEERARASREERRAALIALDPPPAVVLIDDTPWFRWDSGAWSDAREGCVASDDVEFYDDMAELLDGADIIGPHWASIADYDAEAQVDQAA